MMPFKFSAIEYLSGIGYQKDDCWRHLYSITDPASTELDIGQVQLSTGDDGSYVSVA